MNYIDLHVHSSASDGSFTPEEVVELAKNARLTKFALTDHDTIDGIAQAISHANQTKEITVIPGIELSCYYGKREIHIVGLFVDYKDENFLYELQKLKNAREERNIRMVQNFANAGIELTIEELKHGNPNSVITRAHFARVLVEKGYCKDKNEALPLVRRFYNLGFNIEATDGTAMFLKENGIRTRILKKISEGSDEIPNAIRQGHIAYLINTRDIGEEIPFNDGGEIRKLATENNINMFTSLDTVRVLLDVLEETTLTISTIDA